MLPPLSERDYVTYAGSLTTPPCSEGLLWHVLTKPQTISVQQWQQFLTAFGDKVGPGTWALGRDAMPWQRCGAFSGEACATMALEHGSRSCSAVGRQRCSVLSVQQ